MRHDLASSFNTPEFQAIKHKYEEMKQNHTHVYMESNELTHLAEYYAHQGDSKASEEVINYGLQLHPENLDILIYKCNNLVARGKINEAFFLLETIPDQNDREVRLTYANLCLERQDIESAEEVFKQLAEEEDNDTNTLLDIADIYMDANMEKMAYHWLQKAYRQAPNDIEVLESMADYHYSFKSVEQATVYYNKLLDEDPYNLYYWTELTRCYLQMGEIEQAMESVEFALTINENDLTCIEMKGYCFQLLGDGTSACKCYKQVEQSVSNKTRIRMVLMACYFIDKKYDETIQYCNKLLESNDLENFERANVYHKRAVSHLAKGEYEESEKDVSNGLTYDGEFSELYLVQGELFVSEGKMIEAECSFRKAESFAMEKAETAQQAATTYMRYEHFKEAVQLYHWIEKEYPEEVKDFYSYIAFCYYRLKDEKNMLKYMVRSCFYTPESLSNPLWGEKDMGEDQDFFNLARIVLKEIQEGKINVSSFL